MALGLPIFSYLTLIYRELGRMNTGRVHEHLEPVKDVGELAAPIRHVPYRDLTHHLEKMLVYARWGAEELHARGRRAGAWDLLGRPAWRFVRDYFLYGSWRDGRYGLVTMCIGGGQGIAAIIERM